MSIRAKVTGLFLAVILLFGAASVYSYISSERSNASLALVNELFLPLSREVVQLHANIHSLAEDMHRFYFAGDLSSQTSTFSRMVRDLYPYLIRKKFRVVEHLLETQGRGELKSEEDELSREITRASVFFDEMMATGDRAKFDARYSDLRAQLESISHRVDDLCQEVTLAAQREGRDNLISSLFLSAILLMFGLLITLLSHRALMPLPQLINSLKKIMDGDFHQSLKVKTSDQSEIALLAREYNRMLEALRERDVQIRAQQRELLQSERLAAIGQLSAEVVHEIRNPLNSISLNIDWLENELQGSHTEISRTVKSISREIERLAQITESYLVRARVPVSDGDGQRTEVHDLLSEIIDFSREEDRSRNINIETRWAEKEIFIRTDRSRLKQAFLNVLKNAREAMPRGGKLMVETEVNDNTCRIRFSDNGHGMNESMRNRTFQPFFTTKPNGTGLGLMLTRTIVEEAQGSVHCESELGQGTTFTFQFPA